MPTDPVPMATAARRRRDAEPCGRDRAAAAPPLCGKRGQLAGAPVLDPTSERPEVQFVRPTHHGLRWAMNSAMTGAKSEPTMLRPTLPHQTHGPQPDPSGARRGFIAAQAQSRGMG
jgi:hypothetical protein